MKKLLFTLTLLLSIPSFAATIECGRGINLISGDRGPYQPKEEKYNEVAEGIYLYNSSFSFGEKYSIYYSVSTQGGRNFIMARLQEETSTEIKVLGYSESADFHTDPQGNIELTVDVTNTDLMQTLVAQNGSTANQFDLVRKFTGNLGLDSVIGISVSCQMSGLTQD